MQPESFHETRGEEARYWIQYFSDSDKILLFTHPTLSSFLLCFICRRCRAGTTFCEEGCWAFKHWEHYHCNIASSSGAVRIFREELSKYIRSEHSPVSWICRGSVADIWSINSGLTLQKDWLGVSKQYRGICIPHGSVNARKISMFLPSRPPFLKN